jgi:alanine-glyoxylate transaminase/(R)-3-amino-2-methylpropionate-pyruvate transaminase
LARYSSLNRPRAYTGKIYDDVKAERKHLFPLYMHYYKEPFFAVEAYEEFVFDEQGKRYIDLIGGISCVNIGHSHPRLTRIYQE